MRNRFAQFMYGRYGTDKLSQHISLLALILCIGDIFLKTGVMWGIALALIIYVYFRSFSKNIQKRYKEMCWYQARIDWFRNIPVRIKKRNALRKTHRVFRCSSCKQKVKVPRGKGKIEIRCPKCRNTFIKRT